MRQEGLQSLEDSDAAWDVGSQYVWVGYKWEGGSQGLKHWKAECTAALCLHDEATDLSDLHFCFCEN